MGDNIDKFRGHFRAGDPRHLGFCFYGMRELNVPSYRYLFCHGGNIDQIWYPLLQNPGLLFQYFRSNRVEHKDIWYVVNRPWWCINANIIREHSLDPEHNYQTWWKIQIYVYDGFFLPQHSQYKVMSLFGNTGQQGQHGVDTIGLSSEGGGPLAGMSHLEMDLGYGSLFPVEWDKELPPEGHPYISAV